MPGSLSEMSNECGNAAKAYKLKSVLSSLIAEEQLSERSQDHALIGSYKGRRECHLEPDWLLVYKLAGNEIIFERTGTHSDLFE